MLWVFRGSDGFSRGPSWGRCYFCFLFCRFVLSSIVVLDCLRRTLSLSRKIKALPNPNPTHRLPDPVSIL